MLDLSCHSLEDTGKGEVPLSSGARPVKSAWASSLSFRMSSFGESELLGILDRPDKAIKRDR